MGLNDIVFFFFFVFHFSTGRENNLKVSFPSYKRRCKTCVKTQTVFTMEEMEMPPKITWTEQLKVVDKDYLKLFQLCSDLLSLSVLTIVYPKYPKAIGPSCQLYSQLCLHVHCK